jgi:hypothetical protein
MKINGKLNVHTGERVFIDWVVVGGESGPCARPMHPAWARQIKDDCRICGVPFFFKQWGEFLPSLRGACMHPSSEGAQGPARLLDRVDIWKCGLCGMLHDHDFDFVKVGKKEAGRLLDGVEWSQYPA